MTELDGSAIQKIEELVLKTVEPIYIQGEQKGIYYLRDQYGSLTRHRAEIDPRAKTTVYDLESLGRELEIYKLSETAPDGSLSSLESVYVSDSGVVAPLDDDHARWQVDLPLPLHPAFKRVLTFKNVVNLTQKELVRLLRTELVDYVDHTVIVAFQELKITRNSEAVSTQRPTSAALDSHIHQAVQTRSGTAVPEMLTLSLPVYDLPETRKDRYRVNVYVEFDHDLQAFQLIAVHNELREAQEEAIRKIMAAIDNDARIEAPVLYGTPG